MELGRGTFRGPPRVCPASLLRPGPAWASCGTGLYRGELSLSPSDAQRHVEPKRSNGALKSYTNVDGSLKH
eukprot:12071586-Heterocapsa_arctica.AAC.1